MVNWGDGTIQGPITTTSKSFVISHTYADNMDDNGALDSVTFQVIVDALS